MAVDEGHRTKSDATEVSSLEFGGRPAVILTGIDCTEQYEAMKRGEWPEPHPEVVAAHQALALQVVVEDQAETEEGDGRDDG